MAALVQSFPAQQSSSPVSLMQSRPQSASNSLQSAQTQSAHPGQHHLTTPRNMGGYNNSNSNSNNSAGGGYRSGYTTAPVAPYAFTSTPSLSNTKQQPKIGERTSSKPEDSRNRYPAPDSISSSSSSSSDPSSRHQGVTTSGARDDVSQYSRPNARPLSTISTTALPPPQMTVSTSRPSPDRYRRPGNKRSESAMSPVTTSYNGSAQPSGSGMVAVAAIYSQPSRSNSNPSLPQASGPTVKAPFIGDYTGQLRSQSVDDIHTHRHQSTSFQQQMQNRRRSVGPDAFSPESFQNFVRQEVGTMPTPMPIQLSRPGSAASGSSRSQTNETGHKSTGSASSFQPPNRPGNRRTGSTDSSNSANSSRPTSSNRNSIHSASSNTGSTTPHEINPSQVPPRGSSTDLNKRITAPSPLSKPMNMTADSPSSYQTFPEPQNNPNGAPSAVTKSATEQLESLNDTPKKGMKNRLRRAFSFGSAAELRKVSAVNNMRGEEAAERARLRQEKFREEQDAEQLRIVRRQEEAGLGEGIYSGQGNFFTGSTDNISVSSTASSASIMIRKMGKGMKKSTRSLVGLFRPKSIVGVPAASAPVTAQVTTGQVSMVTVEAEREKVNVNADARDQTGGGTGFPKLEQNSLDTPKASDPSTARRTSSAGDTDAARKSFVGGEKERAEVLAAVRKGILKRSGSSSPIIKPSDPSNSAPGLENQRPQLGKQRSDSLKIEGDDYFMSGPRFAAAGSSASAPTSPTSLAKYNVSFSPRITFHDTWPSGEYDRRGEIATCNRLTPMLAQQIKEELNTFKMEMDVHEESKVYTHFF